MTLIKSTKKRNIIDCDYCRNDNCIDGGEIETS